MKNNIFTQVNMARVPQSTFDLSHDKKMSFLIGRLIPTLILETLPGDVFNIQSSQMLRFAPLSAPVMHQVNVYTHYFFVPNRILWPGWENFITGGEDGLDATVWPFANVRIDTIAAGTLSDYLGIPVGEGDGVDRAISVLPYAAYMKIFEDYYRDQNLNPITAPLEVIDGVNPPATWDPITEVNLPAIRAWEHDYFTSALPWTQKGVEATIPLGTIAPLQINSNFGTTGTVMEDIAGVDVDQPLSFIHTAAGVGVLQNDAETAGYSLNITPYTEVDLSTATAASIIDLRNAFKLQEWLEKNARGGTRYIESIYSHFDILSDDARLQRPEFLGGSVSPVAISEVLQTSTTPSEATPLGTQGGRGISVGQSRPIRYRCKEHGFIMGIMSVMPKTAYSQGMHRMWQRITKLNYAWPSFAHIGEQSIRNGEIYLNTLVTDAAVFGYTPRYAEYKYIPSSIHGTFRTTLDFWQMGRKFSALPVLNTAFIECNSTETDRIFAVNQTDENMYAHIYHKISATRKLPYFGNPKM